MEARIPPVATDDMAPDQRELAARIAGARGRVGGPFAFWIRLPEVADAADRLGNALRLHGKLDRKLFELMVLAVARFWTAQYEWFAHERAAREAGLADEIIEAIRVGRAPAFRDAEEALAYGIAVELQTTKRLSDATFERGLQSFGPEVFIEAVTAIGFYTTAAMLINAFAAPVPDGSTPLPPLSS
jgi:4-carboxymuconolactone decarboxylase